MSTDHYSRCDYSRLIAWDQRLEREWPFLREILGEGSRRILDLGSGTGEHARFLASKGFEVVGVDTSPTMLEKARSTAAPGVTFVDADMRAVDAAVEGRFDGAICLGNALPHLNAPDDLHKVARALRRVLSEGAPLVIQIINYDRIEAKRERALPLSFLPDPEDPRATVIFLRTIELMPDGAAVFMPSTLRQRPDLEPPIELISSRRVDIRAWRLSDLETALRGNGFESTEVWGSYAKAPFDREESRDVIVVAR